MPERKSASSSRPQVTVLCGFLGAGKTTLLRHVLAQADAPAVPGGRARWAAVVNDVAALNVDAAVVQAGSESNDVVALGNGCVCCSSRDDLAEAILRLADDGDYEHILVETTGVAEPRGVANLFVQRNPFGPSLADRVELAALVTVVDTALVAQELAQRGPDAPREVLIPSQPRPVVELMLEQLETADVIVLNQCDRATTEDLQRVRQAVAALNPRADVVETEQGQVASEFLLGRVRFDAKATLSGASWIRALNAVVPKPAEQRAGAVAPPPLPGRWVSRGTVRTSHEERFGITSFVYQARRPFGRAKLRGLIEQGVPGLLRAKGFYWLAEQPDEMGFLSVAGGVARFDVLNPWWATLIESGRAKRDDRPVTITALWVEPHGDRRQELVFIGTGLDEAALRAQLDACLE